MRLKLLLAIAGIHIALVANAFAAGTTSANFLRLGIGAKNVAMGETGAADQDENAAYWNPAGLCGISQKSFSFSHAVWFEDISYQNALYAQNIGESAIAVGGTYLSMPGIDKYDNTGLAQGSSYQPSDMEVRIAYARAIHGIPVGLSVKYISSEIDAHSATAVAADAGIMPKPFMVGGRELRVGLAFQNMGTSMKFRNDEFALPFNVKAGVWYAFSERFTAALDVNKAIDTDVVGNGGLQYLMPFGDKTFLAGRAGYRTNVEGLGGMAGITAGVGFGYRAIVVDYAYVPYGDLDDTHRISLKYNF